MREAALPWTGALAVWVSVALSLGGFGLTLRALEARFGRVSLAEFHGLYDHSPALAVCFLLTGLTSVGFPGTLGFVAAELLVDGAVQAGADGRFGGGGGGGGKRARHFGGLLPPVSGGPGAPARGAE